MTTEQNITLQDIHDNVNSILIICGTF